MSETSRRRTYSPCSYCFAAGEYRERCDGRLPCSQCTRDGLYCEYPASKTFSPLRSAPSYHDVERFPEGVNLLHGSTGGLLLKEKRNKRRDVSGYQWLSASEQVEDIRFIQKPNHPPALMLPPSLKASNYIQKLQHKPTADESLLDQACGILPREPIHPTILLSTMLRDEHDALAKTGPVSYYLPEPNFGNTLSISTIFMPGDLPFVTTPVSQAIWKKYGNDNQGTALGYGIFKDSQLSSSTRPNDVLRSRRSACTPEQAGDCAARMETSKKRRISKSTTKSFFVEIRASPRRNVPKTRSAVVGYPVLHQLESDFGISDSPLLQLELASLANEESLLATRTYTTLSLMLLEPFASSGSTPSKAPKVKERFCYRGRDLGSQTISDFAVGSHHTRNAGEGLVVDTRGSLYGWGLDALGRLGEKGWNGSKPEMYKLRSGRDYDERYPATSGHTQVAYGGARGCDAVLGFGDEARLYDLRSSNSAVQLITRDMLSHPTSAQPSLLTSLLRPSTHEPIVSSNEPVMISTSLHVFCTTRDILWVDDRMPGRDLLRWTHGRVGKCGKGLDSTLQLMRIPNHTKASYRNEHSASFENIALHSKINPQIAIFSNSCLTDTAPRSLLDPYNLASPEPNNPNWIRTGLSIVPALGGQIKTSEFTGKRAQRPERMNAAWMVCETGADSSLYTRYVTRSASEATSRGSENDVTFNQNQRPKPNLTTQIEPGVEKGNTSPEFTSPQAINRLPELSDRRAEKIINISNAFQKLTESVDLPPNDENLAESIQKALKIWQKAMQKDFDLGLVTVKDLLCFGFHSLEVQNAERKSTRPEEHLARLSTITRSTALIHAHLFDRLEEKIDASALWRFVSPSMFGMECEKNALPIGRSIVARAQRLKTGFLTTYGLTGLKDDSLIVQACEVLALDLALSSNVFSAKTLSLSSTANNTYTSRAWPKTTAGDVTIPKALVSDEAAPISLSFFSPRARLTEQFSQGDADEHSVPRISLDSRGAKLLLREWKLGDELHSYRWANPYEEEDTAHRSGAHIKSSKRQHRPQKFKTKQKDLEDDWLGELPPQSQEVRSNPNTFAPNKIVGSVFHSRAFPSPNIQIIGPANLPGYHGNAPHRHESEFALLPESAPTQATQLSSHSTSQKIENLSDRSKVIPGGSMTKRKAVKKRVSGF